MKKPLQFIPQKPSPNMWSKEESSTKQKSMDSERRLADRFGFETTPGSGNQAWPSKKGDFGGERFMVEHKETKGPRISINAGVVGKLCREASAVGKTPVLILSAHGLPEPIPTEWAVLPVAVYDELLQLLGGKDE
jgi:hypothetical protein